MFMAVANHACIRDKQSLKTQTDYTLNEIKAITTLSFNFSTNPDWTQFYLEFKPLNPQDNISIFWPQGPAGRARRSVFPYRPLAWSMDEGNLKLPQPQHLPKAKKDFSTPFDEEFEAEKTPYSIFHPEIYKGPKAFWTKSNLIKKLPYEDMQIISDVPSTIPDYIILLHAVWKIEIEKQYHSK